MILFLFIYLLAEKVCPCLTPSWTESQKKQGQTPVGIVVFIDTSGWAEVAD